MTKEDCEKRQGKLITVNINDKDSYDTAFVLNGGSMASIVAEEVCKNNT